MYPLSHLFPALTASCLRWRWGTLILCLLLAIAAASYITKNLGINTSTKDMLSAELDWRKLDLQQDLLFPAYQDNILIAVAAATPDQADDAAAHLFDLLQNEGMSVYYPPALLYFKENAWFFESAEDLYDITTQLAEAQVFIARLGNDPSLRGLSELLIDAITLEYVQTEDIYPLVDEIQRTLDSLLNNGGYAVSWQRLFSGSDTENRKEKYIRYLTVQATLDAEAIFPAMDTITALQNRIQEAELHPRYAAAAKLSGSVVLAHEELESVANANWRAILLSLLGVVLLLYFGLQGNVMVACFINLLFGLLLTTAWATLTVGTLNLISVAFAVLYIGLGIDFSIHYVLRYRELLNTADRNTVLITTSTQMTRPLCLCAMTTAIGFFAFIPTDYTGIAELGWIAGCGMFISLLCNFCLLPVLLSWSKTVPFQRHGTAPGNTWQQYNTAVLLVAAVLLLLAVSRLSTLHFDTNTLHLQDPDNTSVQVYQQMLADPDNTPWAITILADSKQQAGTLAEQLAQLDTVKKVVWLESFVAEKTAEKIAIIDEMSLLMDPPPATPAKLANETQEWLALRKLYETIAALDAPEAPLLRLQEPLSRVITAIDNEKISLSTVRRALLQSLPPRLNALSIAMGGDSNSVLPATIQQRWQNNDTWRLAVEPAMDIQEDANMAEFISSVRTVHQAVSGTPVIQYEAGKAVGYAFQQAFSYAFLAIGLLLLVLLRSWKDTLLLLLILLAGAAYTTLVMTIINMPLNFANIIALPLLLGIGVDSGIHILERYRKDKYIHQNMFGNATHYGVLISALTTIFSVGNLAFATHRGTASMGLLLVIGISIMVCCTLILLPALLQARNACSRSEKKHDKN